TNHRHRADPVHLAETTFKIQDETCMFVQPNRFVIRGNKIAPFRKAIHSNKTTAGIEINAAIGIVPVRNERDMQAKIGKQVQSIDYMNILPNFVDLVNG